MEEGSSAARDQSGKCSPRKCNGGKADGRMGNIRCCLLMMVAEDEEEEKEKQ